LRKTSRVPASLIDPPHRRADTASTRAHHSYDGRRLEGAALLAIVAVAIWLRVIGLGFGLPAVYNQDEVAIMSRALAFAKGDLNPHNFLYPTFYFYALAAWVGASFVFARLTGQVASATEFQARFFTDPTSIYLAGRSLSVVCGVATVLAAYWLARRLFGRAAGLVAALFLAVAPYAVRDAHYVKHDVPATLLLVLAMIATVGIWPHASPLRNPKRDALVAGAACGLAFSTHYYTVFLVLPLAWAIWCREAAEGAASVVRQILLAAVAATIVFFALSPFVLVEPLTAWRDIVANREIVIDRALTGGGLLPNALAYARMLTRDAIGTPVVIAACIGLGRLCYSSSSSWRVLLLLLAFPVAFLVFISNTVPASRYLNPVLPFVALLAGSWTRQMSASRRHARLPAGRDAGPSKMVVVAWAVGSIAVAALPFWDSYKVGRFFQLTDTRTLALDFFEQHVPAHATVLVQPYSVPLVQSRDGLLEALERNLGDARRASIKFVLRLALDPYPSPAYRTIFLGDGGLDADKIYVGYGELGGASGLRALQRLGVQYVAVKRYNRPDLATRPFFEALEREARRLAVFSPYRSEVSAQEASRIEPFLHNTDAPIDPALERPGPLIEIWELNDRSRSSS